MINLHDDYTYNDNDVKHKIISFQKEDPIHGRIHLVSDGYVFAVLSNINMSINRPINTSSYMATSISIPGKQCLSGHVTIDKIYKRFEPKHIMPLQIQVFYNSGMTYIQNVLLSNCTWQDISVNSNYDFSASSVINIGENE